MSVPPSAVPSCPLCGAGARPDLRLAPLPLATCSGCGLTFRPSLTDDEATRALYESGRYGETHSDHGHDTAADEERRAHARTRLAFVQDHAPPRSSLLDVGAAGGAFVLEAGRAGFDARGLEPVPGFARHAREVVGVDVRDGRIDDVEPASADVITLWHVFEHVPDPVGGLRVLRDGLRPGGRLFLEVPNLGSLAAAGQGTAWTHLDAETHVTHFTRDTLRAALTAAHLAPVVELSVGHDDYLTAAERRRPRHLAARAKLFARAARDGRRADPFRHEFLRVVARAA